MSVAKTEVFDNFIDPLANHETLMFIGCVHAITDEFLWLLKRIEDNPPQYLFFGGDLTGSEPFEKLKTLFYECVFNRVHNQLGIGTDQEKEVSDKDLLDFVGHCPRNPTQTVFEGYIELMTYVSELLGEPPEGIQRVALYWRGRRRKAGIAIRALANRDYFGSWHMELPLVVRQATANGIKEEAEKLAKALEPIQKLGTKIIMIAGNWDNVENNQKGNWGSDVEVFNTVSFYRDCGFEFHDTIATTMTEKALVVAVPYWELAEWDHETTSRLRNTHLVTAGTLNKTTIVLAHGEPSWEVHELGMPVPSQEARRQVIQRLGEVLFLLAPDEVIYPHQHHPLCDKEGKRLPSRTKYQMQTRRSEKSVELVRNQGEAYRENSPFTVSYLPYQRIGVTSIPLKNHDPHLKPIGDRDPVYVF